MKEEWDISYIKEPRQLPNGKWSVYGVLPHRDKNAKRKRVRKEGFKSKDEAEAWRKEMQVEGLLFLRSGVKRYTPLSVRQESDALCALEILRGKYASTCPPTLEEVVKYCADHSLPYGIEVTKENSVIIQVNSKRGRSPKGGK